MIIVWVSCALILTIEVFMINNRLLVVVLSIRIVITNLLEDLKSSIRISNFKKPITGLNFLQIHYKKI